jgi:outer membrane protein OmpA-like peptidoglycan-associated protein
MRIFLISFLISAVSFAQSSSAWNYELSKVCFNSPFDDFGVRKIAGRYFMISASIDSGNVVYKDQVTGRPFTDLYELNGCKKVDAYLRNAIVGQNFLLSSPQNDGNISGDFFGKIIFFSSNYFDSLADKTGLFYMKRTQNGWSTPFFFPLNSKQYDLNHPCYDSYNKVLYFSSNMPGGKGGNDIYKIPFDGTKFGKISPVIEVNSPKDEIFPSVVNNVFYFSSQREGGQGGLDVYKLENSLVEALPKGINTMYDDFDYYPLGEFTAFMASNREGQGKNDEVYFVTRSSIPFHELKITPASDLLTEINENIQLFSKLPLSSELKEPLIQLKEKSRKLEKQIHRLYSLNEELNERFPELVSDVISQNVHSSSASYDEKDQQIFDLSVQFELLSTTHDSLTFIKAYERAKSIIENSSLENSSRFNDRLNNLLIDGLSRIESFNQLNDAVDQVLAMNEALYFSLLTEKSNGITEQQWQTLASTQAGLTEKIVLLEEQRKIDSLSQQIENQNRQLELLMKEFQATMNDDKFNAFYKLDSLFSIFKSNPNQENAVKLKEAFGAFDPSLLNDLASLIESSNLKRDQLNVSTNSLATKQAKFEGSFQKEFEAFTLNVKKGETIGLKEELNRIKQEYSWIPSAVTDSILNKFIFWETDVLAKFGTLGNILFSFDSYELTTISKAQLDTLILLYNETPTAKLLLNGYTDNSGPYKYNLKLSRNRANSVRTYLIKKGVPRKALVMYYHGEKFPSVENSTREGRKLNRRVELKIEIPTK